jgi:hypothetical protein
VILIIRLPSYTITRFVGRKHIQALNRNGGKEGILLKLSKFELRCCGKVQLLGRLKEHSAISIQLDCACDAE